MIEISNKIEKTLVIPVFEKNNKISYFDNNKNKELKKEILKELKSFHYEAKQNEQILLKIKNQKILLIGINEKYSLEDLRRGYSSIFSTLKSKKEYHFSIEVPKENEENITAIIEGIDLTNYKFDMYLSKKEKEIFKINLLISNKYSKIIKETLIVTNNVKITRNMVNENADEMIPTKFEKIAKGFAKKHNLKINLLDEKNIQKNKLGLLWAVGKGAKNPPRLIIIEYNGNKNSKDKLALVGKGITFDTGGLNLKPTNYIEDMRTDMGGAATMFNAFKSAVELKLKKNLVLVLCCAENAISAGAFKPGDIFKSYKGSTVEITNTDAEGRLVLADGISYVQKHYKVTHIIDAATLTGAILVALGKKLIGMFGNDEKMKKELFKSGEETHDRVWEMPIYEEHKEGLKSKFADLVNADKARYGGASSAAAFIEHFIEKDIKWVHLDIAGAARGYAPDFYVPEMGTGKGVRLLVDFLKNE